MTPKIALVTGATQGLGLALVEGLAARLATEDTVYLTGRDAGRVAEAVEAMPAGGAEVRGEVLDVAEPGAPGRLAARLAERHGGVDVVIGNAVMRVGPDDDPRAIVDDYAEVNNFGTTRLLRAFAPLLRDDGRFLVVASSFGTLHHLAPALHDRFDRTVLIGRSGQAGRGLARRGRGRQRPRRRLAGLRQHPVQDRPGRGRAHARRPAPRRRPGPRDPARRRLPRDDEHADVRAVVGRQHAPSPAQAADTLLDLVFRPLDPAQYGELVRDGAVLPWR